MAEADHIAKLVRDAAARLAARDPDGALKILQHAYREAPESIAVLRAMAAACQAAGRIPAVVEIYERLARRAPGDRATLLALTDVYEQTQQYGKAYQTFLQAAGGKAGASHDLARLGQLALYAGNAKDASTWLTAALEKDPKNATALTLMGRCHMAGGDKSAAEQAFRAALGADPGHLNAWFYLAEVAKFGADDPAFRTLEDLKTKGRLDAPGLSTLGFALGRMYEGAGDYERAFENFTIGNAERAGIFKAKGFSYDRHEIAERHAAMTQPYTPENRANLIFQGSASTVPVFILGMPRTGSTLLEQMLASHSDVASAGEVGFLGSVHYQLLNSLKTQPGPARPRAYGEALSREGQVIAGAYLKELSSGREGARYVIDKMPFNFEQLGLISVLFPNAKIIHVTRDPRDVALSIYTNQFAPSWPFAHDLADIGHFYNAYDALMARWRDVLDVAVHAVSYEALTDDPEKTLRGVFGFLGLPWQEQCLAFYKNQGHVFTTSAGAVRNPVHRGAQGRWRNYQKHLAPFLAALKPNVKA